MHVKTLMGLRFLRQRPARKILIGAFSSPGEAKEEIGIACSLWHNGFRTGVLNLPFSISQPQKTQSLHCKIPVLLQVKLCAKQMQARSAFSAERYVQLRELR